MTPEDVPLGSVFWAPTRSGINEEVYSAAQAEWRWTCDYVRRVLHDDSNAADLLQASAAAISRACPALTVHPARASPRYGHTSGEPTSGASGGFRNCGVVRCRFTARI
jgi:hypothetical protein